MNAVMKILRIKRVQTTAYHPQINDCEQTYQQSVEDLGERSTSGVGDFFYRW
jgi:hypothetical protein